MSAPLPRDGLGEAAEVLSRAAALPRGLAFLHMAPLETVAITLSLDARLVERVRRMIDDPSTHAAVIEAYREAVARCRAGGAPALPGDGHPAPPDPLPEIGAEELIGVAGEHSLGIPFLFDAPPETVAVVFGVTPFVVLEARGILERRGVRHEIE